MAIQTHDSIYKTLFTFPDMVESLVRDWLQGEWISRLDFSTLEPCPAEYIADNLESRRNDILWRVKSGEKYLYFYLMLEFQSTVDPWMALRITTYSCLLCQGLIKAEQITEGQGLPPILPIVLYNGDSRWTAAQETAELFESVPGELAGIIPRHGYILLSEKNLVGEAEKKSKSLTAKLFQLESFSSKEETVNVFTELYSLLSNPKDEELLRAFIVMIHIRILRRNDVNDEEIILPQDPMEAQTMLSNALDRYTEEHFNKGRLEGRLEGKLEGRLEGKLDATRDIARKLIPLHDLATVSKITGLTLAELEEIRRKLEQ